MDDPNCPGFFSAFNITSFCSLKSDDGKSQVFKIEVKTVFCSLKSDDGNSQALKREIKTRFFSKRFIFEFVVTGESDENGERSSKCVFVKLRQKEDNLHKTVRSSLCKQSRQCSMTYVGDIFSDLRSLSKSCMPSCKQLIESWSIWLQVLIILRLLNFLKRIVNSWMQVLCIFLYFLTLSRQRRKSWFSNAFIKSLSITHFITALLTEDNVAFDSNVSKLLHLWIGNNTWK